MTWEQEKYSNMRYHKFPLLRTGREKVNQDWAPPVKVHFQFFTELRPRYQDADLEKVKMGDGRRSVSDIPLSLLGSRGVE